MHLLELVMTRSLEFLLYLTNTIIDTDTTIGHRDNQINHATSNWEKMKFMITNLHNTMWRISVIRIPSSEREQPITVIYSKAFLCPACSCKELICESVDQQIVTDGKETKFQLHSLSFAFLPNYFYERSSQVPQYFFEFVPFLKAVLNGTGFESSQCVCILWSTVNHGIKVSFRFVLLRKGVNKQH